MTEQPAATTPPFLPLPPAPAKAAPRASALPTTGLPPLEPVVSPAHADPELVPDIVNFDEAAHATTVLSDPDMVGDPSVSPEEKAFLEDEIVTPEDTQTPAPPVPPSLTPDEQVQQADVPARTARRGRPAGSKNKPKAEPISDARKEAEVLLAKAEADLAAASERFAAAVVEHDAALAAQEIAQRLADWAHAHPLLQD